MHYIFIFGNYKYEIYIWDMGKMKARCLGVDSLFKLI
jgi:hypothetical protein